MDERAAERNESLCRETDLESTKTGPCAQKILVQPKHEERKKRTYGLRENDDLRAVGVAVALQLRDRRLRGGAFGGQRVDLQLAVGAELRSREHEMGKRQKRGGESIK